MAGFSAFVRLILRRDRVKLPVWIVGFSGLLLLMIPMLREVYPDEESLRTLYTAFGASPAGLFMTGPMDAASFGALMTIETLLWWGFAIAFMNTLLIVRHTRQNEEIGAQELLLSGRAHRSTGLVAALVVAFGANIAITILVGMGMSAMESSWSHENAWLYAVSMGVFGFVWAAIAAVVVQLTESTRSANGILALSIGAAFVVRGVGDFLGRFDNTGLHEPSWVSSLSPFGWLQATRPLTLPEWQPLIVSGTFAVVMGGCAFALLARRDVGSSVLPSRRGRARATRLLQTPLGLTWYLQKNIFVGWLIGTLVMAATIGILVPQMSTVYSDSDNMKHLIESIGGTGALIPSFLSAMLAITALMVFAYAMHGMGRARGEESNGHLEPLLATRLSRQAWLGLHAAVVVAGGILILALTGITLAVCVNVASDYTANTVEYLYAALSYIPVMLLFMSVYMLLFGLFPRLSGLVAWMYFGFVAFMVWLGPMLRLDEWIMNLSVMTHVAAPPAEEIIVSAVGAITALSIAGMIAGFIAWRRRDVS